MASPTREAVQCPRPAVSIGNSLSGRHFLECSADPPLFLESRSGVGLTFPGLVKAVLGVETLCSLIEREHEQVRILIPERRSKQSRSDASAVRSLIDIDRGQFQRWQSINGMVGTCGAGDAEQEAIVRQSHQHPPGTFSNSFCPASGSSLSGRRVEELIWGDASVRLLPATGLKDADRLRVADLGLNDV